MILRLTAVLLGLFVCLCAGAQYKVSGKVVDGKDRQPLPGAQAILTPAGGGKPQGQVTGLDGDFSIVKMPAGTYTLKVAFVGYATVEKQVVIKDADVNVRVIRLNAEDTELKEVKAVGTLVRQEQKGDTTVFNADAFKVNPDATTEDLIKKMPGMQVGSDGSVTHGGETVKKVLVDGKEFFGSDASIALKNIDASMVKQIEVYDRQSDQSQFTGFSDGNEERTINILTKMGIKSGRFGRAYGGYGTDSHYEAGGSMNFFRGDHRVSVLGMLNNVNQQNFSFDDVTGAMANGGGGAMRGMWNGGRSGINRTGAVGVNYNYEKEEKMRLETSYFFNYNKNNRESESYTEYFAKNDTDFVSTQNSVSESESHNYNHRANVRMRWKINADNTLIFNPSISWQKYDGESLSDVDYALTALKNRLTKNSNDNETRGYNLSGDLTWQHRFSIPRRTISLRVNGSQNVSDSEGESANIRNEKIVSDSSDRWETLMTAQKTDNESNRSTLGARLQYTEPFGEHVALQINYNPSYTLSKGDKVVSADSLASEDYADVLPAFSNYKFSNLLSNKKETEYTQHRAGAGVNIFNGKVFNATLGVDYQHSVLDGEQFYPLSYTTHKQFTNIMPSAEMRLQRGKSLNMRFVYRSNSSAPSVNQLQSVVDVSNINSYSSGNPDLNQSTTHNIRLMTAANNVETSRFIFLMLNYSFTNDYIAQHTMRASKDSIIDNNILLPAGTTYSKPVNLDGYKSARVHINMSTPVKWLGSNVNLTLGANMTNSPGMNNYRSVTTKDYTLNGGLNIGSSFSENVDFNVGYNGRYNIKRNTFDENANKDSYSHNVNVDFTCLFANQRIVFSNSLNHNFTKDLSDKDNGSQNVSLNQNYLMWNAALGAKFFKDRRGELRLRVNDLLDTAESTGRSIDESKVTTSTTNVLKRYAMLTFTYKFKSIGDVPQMQMPPFMGGGRGRMPRH